MYLLSPKHDSEILFSSKGEPLSNIKIHIPDIPHIPHIPHIPDIPDIPEIFDLGISSQTGFFLGGVFGTFFWVGFLAQHGPEPPSPILLQSTGLLQNSWRRSLFAGKRNL